MATLEPIADDDAVHMEDMVGHARSARDLLKALAHETRLMILCLLVQEERSVGELEQLMGLRQPSVSQQLAEFRPLDGGQTRSLREVGISGGIAAPIRKRQPNRIEDSLRQIRNRIESTRL